MLRPAMSEMIKKDESNYSFVIAVAKRAREIAVEAEEEDLVLDEKPVQLAVNEFASGRRKTHQNAASTLSE